MGNRKAATCGLMALLLLAACADLPPTQPLIGPEEAINPFLAAAPPAPQAPWGLDGELAALAREVPGFGGMFYDEAGRLNVYLAGVQPLAAGDVAARLLPRLQARGLATAAEVVVREGEYDFLQLSRWHQQALGVFDVGGVVFTDADERSNRLRIGLESRVSPAAVEQRLAELGIPREAVILEEAEPIVPMVARVANADVPMSGHTLRDRVRPVAGGLQINFPGFLCTLGFSARARGIPGTYFTTNSHCTAERGTVTGTPYWQPLSSVPNSFIGTEIHDPPFFTGGIFCPQGWRCRFSDAAGARYASGVDVAFGSIYRTLSPGTTTPGSLEIDPATPRFRIVGEVAFPLAGQTVHKVGRTTGWTQGSVLATCVFTSVINTNILILCQDFVRAGVGSGDSGSPVFERIGTGNDVRLHGILWGAGGSDLYVFTAMENLRLEFPGNWRPF